jgi:tetratricopeptide (TPR) repeat protein
MADFISEIRQRRVLPALGVYVGSCWVLIEILDRLVERYLLSPYLTDIAFWGLYSLIPAVILVAWTHGKPGKDRITTAEKVGLPINFIATIGLVMTLFSDKDLGAAAELVTISDEHGQTVSQYVAGKTHRRKMAIFFWENQTGQSENDWLSYALTELLSQDLQQSPFVQATSPWSGGPNGMYLQIKQAGFNNGLGLPTSLMRRIADGANRDYFVDGTIAQADGEWVLTARIWNSQTAALIGTVEQRGGDIYSLTDQISVGIRDILKVPTGGAVEDLQLVDTYGESSKALQSYIDGLNAWLFENDLERAQEKMDQALQIDSQFVLAWYFKALFAAQQGDLGRGQAAFEEARKMDYRLPAVDRMIVKANLYRMAGETEKLESFLRMHVRLNDDVRSRSILAGVLVNTGHLDEARALYLEALEIDPSEIGMLRDLADISRAENDQDAAIEYISEFLGSKPDDVDAHLTLGDMYRESGDFDAAATAYEQALFVTTGDVEPIVRMSELASSRGNLEEATGLLQQAAEEASAPDQMSLVLSAESHLYQRSGQIRRALETVKRKLEYDREFMPPFAVIMSQSPEQVMLNLQVGQIDRAREIQAEAMAALEPPMNQFLAFNEAMILLYEGDFEAAVKAVERGSLVIEQFGLSALEFQVAFSKAKIASHQGDHAAAAEQYAIALELISSAIVSGIPEMMNLRPDMVGWLATEQTRAGDFEAARKSIEYGFKLDLANPKLWMARAEMQFARGDFDLAEASLNYTFAIWKDADPDYYALKAAQDLLGRIESHGAVANSR